eukprot:5700738-Pyramimonas_sp.AAC.1
MFQFFTLRVFPPAHTFAKHAVALGRTSSCPRICPPASPTSTYFILAPPCGGLGATGGLSWAALGRSWGRLGALLGRAGRRLGRLGALLGRLGAVLGALLGALGTLLGPSWKRSVKEDESIFHASPTATVPVRGVKK